MLTFHENKDKLKTFEEIIPGFSVHAIGLSIFAPLVDVSITYMSKKLGQRAAQIQKRLFYILLQYVVATQWLTWGKKTLILSLMANGHNS